MRFTYIYTLTDPRDDLVHYVGKTNSPKRRNWEHCCKSKAKEYSPWHEELVAFGLKPILEVVEEVSGNGIIQERQWIEKLRAAGHPLVNPLRFYPGDPGEGKTDFRGAVILTAEEIRAWRAKDIQAKWRKWWDSLSEEEKSRRQRAKTNEKSAKAGREAWKNMNQQQRADSSRKKSESHLRRSASMTAKERREYWWKIHPNGGRKPRATA